MTTPHPHAELLRKLADDVHLVVQRRKKALRGDPRAWIPARPVDVILSDNGDYWEYRFSDDWRNRFRDALERGEVVTYRAPTGGQYQQITTTDYLFPSDPSHYRIYPPAPKPFECWGVKNLDGVVVGLYSSEDTARRYAGRKIKMREVTDE